MATDAATGIVEGSLMDRSIADFLAGCCVIIREEQHKFMPDNALIGLLCDAVRCARELGEKTAALGVLHAHALSNDERAQRKEEGI